MIYKYISKINYLVILMKILKLLNANKINANFIMMNQILIILRNG